LSTVTGLTAAAMQDIADASIVSGTVNLGGHLILTKSGGGTQDAGSVQGPTGVKGDTGPAGASGIMPSGTIVMFAASIPPTGWLLCDNTLVSRTTYAALFAAIGTTYGIGNGTTTFALPDMRNHYPRMDASQANLGNTGGNTTHTHTIAAHAHNLDGGSPQATAHIEMESGTAPNFYMERVTSSGTWTANFQGDTSTVGSSSHNVGVGARVAGNSSAGGAASTGSVQDNLPPYTNVNFIIKI
jgi:microcystin-dependent protein